MVLDDRKQSSKPKGSIIKTAVSFLSGLVTKGITTNLVGIDFSPNEIKVLKLNSAGNSHYEVENFGVIPIPQGLITKDGIKDTTNLSNLLKDLFRDASISSKDVAFAIPRSSAIIKSITIDSRLNAEEIESRAWIEANRLFPDLVGDIYLDFTITGPAASDPNALELVLVACRKDQVKPYLETLKLAGLTPKMVDVNCYALERALPLVAPDELKEVVAILNLTTNLSSFIVVQNKNLLHAHDQTYDGQRLLTQANNYIANKQKEKPNEPINLADDPGYQQILKENLISHLRHTVHFFYSSRPHVSIKEIILSGECACIPHLAQFIEKEISTKTTTANPFLNMQIGPQLNLEKLQKCAPSLMICCGLSLNEK